MGREKNIEYILAIDQGTTGSRAVVYDKKGRLIEYFENIMLIERIEFTSKKSKKGDSNER